MISLRLRRALVAAVCLVWSTGCHSASDRAAVPSAPQRLVDRLPAPDRGATMLIDGTLKMVLPKQQAEQRFALEGLPPDAQLVTALGVQEGAAPVQFQVSLERPGGGVVSILDTTIDTPGWHEQRVALPEAGAGAELVFRRTAPLGRLLHSAWGNPKLLGSSPRPRPSVLLVSIDTLRADFVGAYGNHEVRSPTLDQLAREGTVYEQVYSPSTWTLPSHAAMFYGLHIPKTPEQSRAEHLVSPTAELPARGLAAVLRENGYLTAAFTGGGFLSWAFDFSRGFGTYFSFEGPPPVSGECPNNRFDGQTVFDGARAWLAANRNQPFFLFVHTYDVHDRCPFVPAGTPLFGGLPPLDAAHNRALQYYYQRLILNTDGLVADLLATLDDVGRRDDTIVVVTSDHGEAFDEHGTFGHGCDLRPYEELSRVPLIIRYPGRVAAGQRVAEPVSGIDLAPTLLALLGLPAEPGMRGGILPDLGLPPNARTGPAVFTQCGDALAVRRGPYKLLTSYANAYREELYDLSRDPHEKRPLNGYDEPRRQLRADAQRFWQEVVARAGTVGGEHEPLDGAAQERLRALGYAN